MNRPSTHIIVVDGRWLTTGKTQGDMAISNAGRPPAIPSFD